MTAQATTGTSTTYATCATCASTTAGRVLWIRWGITTRPVEHFGEPKVDEARVPSVVEHDVAAFYVCRDRGMVYSLVVATVNR